MKNLLEQVRSCQLCKGRLPFDPKPVVQASVNSRIVIIGQAPGARVQKSGIPWDDPSGDLLRHWMQLDKEAFYNENLIALIPMGFCYPGKGGSGDLPPRVECAPQWHRLLSEKMPNSQLTVLIGQYSQRYYLSDKLGDKCQRNLTETVRNFEHCLPNYFPLPHPSPRNRFWMKKNPWFNAAVLPAFSALVRGILRE